jgi:hypothetical protein
MIDVAYWPTASISTDRSDVRFQGSSRLISDIANRSLMTPEQNVGGLAAASVRTAVRAIASCGWSRYAALTA